MSLSTVLLTGYNYFHIRPTFASRVRSPPPVHESVATVVTEESNSAAGSAKLQAEAAQVRKEHERSSDLKTAKMLGGSEEDLHEPIRNDEAGNDAIGAAGTVIGNIFGGGNKMDAPVIDSQVEEQNSHSSSDTSSSSNASESTAASGGAASEERFSEMYFGLRQQRRRR